MFTTIDQFTSLWEREAADTVKVFEAITSEIFRYSTADYRRSVARLANHITETLQEMPAAAGLDTGKEYQEIDTIDALIRQYKALSEKMLYAVKTSWTDHMLGDQISMYGQDDWTRGSVLQSIVLHQCHHRGQLTVLIRLAGGTVPGIYGPSYDEWKMWGQEPHK
jgi:uncharacterized damage-inducible protein DinB